MRRGRIPRPGPLLFLLAGLAAVPVLAQPAKPRPSATAAVGARSAAHAVAIAIRAQSRGELARFYASRGFWPIWATKGRIGPEADRLIAHLDDADIDGLRPSAYRTAQLREAIAAARTGNPQMVAAAEIALSKALARYVADQRKPRRVEVKYLDSELKPRALRAGTVLRAVALQKALGDYVSTMGWMSPHYVRIRTLLAQARDRGAPAETVRRLRLNLDRARLLPGPFTRHVVVDAASSRLWYYEGGKQRAMMKVVTGAPETPTPMLIGMVRYAILNPYWNVPDDLTRRRLAPKIAAGTSAASLRMEVLSDWSATPRKLDPAEVDWAAVAAGKQQVRLRQLPGGSNAMGKVKFMFPNDLGIYLHDTPERSLFNRVDRHLSNGCIRLQDATALGRLLFGKPLPAVAKMPPEQPRALPVPVPVYLTYLTATPTERGIGFLADVYDRDR